MSNTSFIELSEKEIFDLDAGGYYTGMTAAVIAGAGGGALAGSFFSPVGTIVGAVAGGVVGGVIYALE